ncbi:hypothetical protein HMPREF3293_02021 [Christensenella minuta]|uniref:Uncharacterized protein n=1 Tax=Christensenella minuta TaxID=626937 RepID=A0A136Q271_9FIRM|nr:hypothetical protein HMPREF3293_02021 [Christensenella minuta]
MIPALPHGNAACRFLRLILLPHKSSAVSPTGPQEQIKKLRRIAFRRSRISAYKKIFRSHSGGHLPFYRFCRSSDLRF